MKARSTRDTLHPLSQRCPASKQFKRKRAEEEGESERPERLRRHSSETRDKLPPAGYHPKTHLYRACPAAPRSRSTQGRDFGQRSKGWPGEDRCPATTSSRDVAAKSGGFSAAGRSPCYRAAWLLCLRRGEQKQALASHLSRVLQESWPLQKQSPDGGVGLVMFAKKISVCVSLSFLAPWRSPLFSSEGVLLDRRPHGSANPRPLSPWSDPGLCVCQSDGRVSHKGLASVRFFAKFLRGRTYEGFSHFSDAKIRWVQSATAVHTPIFLFLARIHLAPDQHVAARPWRSHAGSTGTAGSSMR